MKVGLSKRAQRAITRIDARWRERGDHPETFVRELLAAVELLEGVRAPGTPCPTERRPLLKRLLLVKSKCHVYFELNEPKRRVEVLTVWDGRRDRPPNL